MAKRKKSGITGAYESLPKIVKILIQLIFGVVVGGIYRIVRFFETGHALTLVAGILMTFTGIGNVIAWIIDLLTELFSDRIILFAA